MLQTSLRKTQNSYVTERVNAIIVKKEKLDLSEFVKMRRDVTKACSERKFTRAEVPQELVSWRVPLEAYNPPDYTDTEITENYNSTGP